MKKVFCNLSCQKEFVVIQPGSEIIQNDVERVGFDCPHCGQTYTLHYINDKVRKLQSEQRKLLASTSNKTERQLKGLLFRIKANKTKIQKEMDELRKVYDQNTMSSL